MKTFNLSQNDDIFIYGAGELGKQTYLRIRAKYRVRGFLDKRIIEMQFGFPQVYSIEDGYILCPTACVIICVHNANWHYEIAERLSESGFSNIIFLPVDIHYNEVIAGYMKAAFNFFWENEYDYLSNVPVYAELKKENKDECIIRKNKTHVVTRCPHQLIYQYNGVELHQRSVFDQMIKSGFLSEADLNSIGVPIAALEMYLSVFLFFETGEKTEDFDKNICVMQEVNNSFSVSSEEFLLDQWKIYELLEREFENGLESMQFSPIDVEWNSRGYFNILDGHHRAVFLYMKGVRDFVVRMKTEDYDKWKNRKAKERVQQAIEKILPSTRILNPYFMKADIRYSEYGSTISDYLCSYIIEKKYSFDVFIEYGDWNGNLSREVYRMGRVRRVISFAIDIYDMELQRALNEMYYMPDNEVQVKLDRNIAENICNKRVGIVCEGKISREIWERIEEWNTCTLSVFNVLEHDKMIDGWGNEGNYRRQVIAKKCMCGKQMDLLHYEVTYENSEEG